MKYFKMLILVNFSDLFFQFDLYADRLIHEYIRYIMGWIIKEKESNPTLTHRVNWGTKTNP